MTRYYLRSKGTSTFEGPYDTSQIGDLLRARPLEEIDCLEATGQTQTALKRSTAWRNVREFVAAARTPKPPAKPCRNCAGTEFYTQAVTFGGDAGAILPVGAFFGAEGRVRVCGACGLAEWFLDPDSLQKAKKKFRRE